MQKEMLREIVDAPGIIHFETVPVPEIGPDQILMKINKIGICGSDIHVYHGQHAFVTYPLTQGHEVSGSVAAIGSNVTQFRMGQKVTFEPQVFCGECYPCTHGKYNLCESLKVMGFQTLGAAAEYFAVEASKVDALPEELTYEEGAMIEPLAVTVHAAKRFPAIKGSRVAILGCGPIGLLLAQTCKALGAQSVMITDISDYRLSLAEQLGVDFCVNTARRELGEAMVESFGPDKADVIYDCAGNDTTMGQAIKYARKGSTIILVAVFAKMATIDLAVLNDHELDLNTTMMYRHEDYVDAIRLVEEGKVQLRPLMSKNFPFEEFDAAYRYIDKNREKVMKVLIDVDLSEA